MLDRATLERETNEFRREITNLETQVRSVRDYIAAQERNLRSAADTVRSITERSIAEARSDLQLKELRLQQVRQDLQAKQVYLSKMAEIDRKQQDIKTLERERDRIASLLDRAQADLQQLTSQYQALNAPTLPATEYVLTFSSGARYVLPTTTSEMMIGCSDPGVFPDIDLTPLGGTANGVSRRHAVMRNTNGAWTITDLNSTNGTYVNATKIGPNMPTPLQSQTKLRFGNLDAVFAQNVPVGNKTTRLS
jgi:pSer/pThr/pTyr-binding forkhead associated (FHA) protein